MKPAILILASIIIITVVACSKSSPVDRELHIPLGDCRPVSGNDDIKLCYDSLDDSRCPYNSDIYCIWRGIGVGHFTFQINKQKHVLTLATYNFGHWRTDTTVAGYTIALLELNPYPTHPAPQPAEQRTAAVRITKQ
jgi:hypothetical protein